MKIPRSHELDDRFGTHRAAERIQELIDDPATAPLRVQRLHQMRAWLTVGCGSIGTGGRYP